MQSFNMAEINLCTESEGPGKRLAIWFQGCNIDCKGCCNEKMRDLTLAHIMSLQDLLALISRAKAEHNIEGVTYLGGEPTLQQSLPLLTAGIRDMNLGVIAFTGRLYEDVASVLAGCDLVVDGPYIESKKSSSRRIVGSDNQRLLFLTERYKDSSAWFYTNIGSGDFNIIDDFIVYNGSYHKMRNT